MPKRKNTSTSTFGSPGRISHDSSRFYQSKLYEEVDSPSSGVNTVFLENSVPPEYLDTIFHKSSETMEELPDHSIHLMVTSPPYNVSKEYDDNLSLHEYRELLHRVFSETYRVLVTGGRACVNIANVGRKPYIPYHTYIIEEMKKCGFLMRGEIIWDKGASAGASTAWGSWCSPANPCLRDTHEYILVFCKDSFSRKPPEQRQSTILKEDFLAWTKSVWEFSTISARKVGHPAPFPQELPHRLIQLYTYEGEIILDPFCGSGQTCIAALEDQRHFVGYEINQEYVEKTKKRVAATQKKLPSKFD